MFIGLLLLFQLSLQDCLPKELLATLGLTPLSATSFTSTSLVCPSLFEVAGACVDPTLLADTINSDISNLRLSMQNFASMAPIFQNSKIIVENQVLSPAVNRSEVLRNLKTTYHSAISNLESCYQNLATLQTGVTCHLASGNATAATDVELVNRPTSVQPSIANIPFGVDLNSKEPKVKVKLDLGSIPANFTDSCYPVFNALCTFMNGNAFLYKITSSMPNTTFFQSVYQNVCQDLAARLNCDDSVTVTDPANVCFKSKKRVLLEGFVRPYLITFMPTTNDISMVNNFLQNLASNVYESVFYSRLLQVDPLKSSRRPTPQDVYLVVNDTTLNLYLQGANANAKIPSFINHSWILFRSFVLFLLLI